MRNDPKSAQAEAMLPVFASVILMICTLSTGVIRFPWNPASGSHRLYAHTMVLLLADLLTVVYFIIFLRRVRGFTQKAAQSFILFLVLLMCSLVTVNGLGYFQDVLGGTETVSGDFYRFGKELAVFEETTGDTLFLKLEKKPAGVLRDSYQGTDPDKILKISDHISVPGSRQTLKVEYYPNTHLVKQAQFLETGEPQRVP